MATISTTIELVDRISGRLAAIGKRTSALTDCFLILDAAVNAAQKRMEGFERKSTAAEIAVPEMEAWMPPAPAVPKMEAWRLAAPAVPETEGRRKAAPEMRNWMQPELAGQEAVQWSLPGNGYPQIGKRLQAEIETPEWTRLQIPDARQKLLPVLDGIPELPYIPAVMKMELPEQKRLTVDAEYSFAQPVFPGLPEYKATGLGFPGPELMPEGRNVERMFLLGQEMMAAMDAGMRLGAALTQASLQEICMAAEQALALHAEGAGMIGNRYTAALALGITDGKAGAYSAAYGVGAHAATGMVNGIYSKLGAVRRAGAALANAAESAMRSTLDVHSPSRVTEEIGLYFGEGFANGIAASASAVQGAAGRLTEASYGAFADDFAFDGDVLSLSEGDIKRLRQIAEREVVNRFTTAELKIDFTANNNINSNMDLDGVVSYLEEQLTERLEMAAEGVYS